MEILPPALWERKVGRPQGTLSSENGLHFEISPGISDDSHIISTQDYSRKMPFPGGFVEE